jgi:RNA polymerase sigma-70 factor, ECF subfamily
MLARTDTFHNDLVAALPGLKAFAVSLCKNLSNAEDLLQETVLKALNNKHQFELGTNINAWLTTIMKNHFLWGLQKKREQEDPDGALAEAMTDEFDPLRYTEARDLIRVFALLPEHQRLLLTQIADGCSYPELAEMLDVPLGTVKSRVHRGRELLQRLCA